MDQSEFYSSWLYSAIRLYCDLKGGTYLDDILKEFQLSREKALKILGFLVSRGLLKMDGAKYLMGTSRTYLSKDSVHISKHHSNWRIRAIEKSQFLSDDELMFTGPITLSREDFFKLREKMVQLISELSAVEVTT